MKKILIIIAVFAIALQACKKNEAEPGLAALTVVNATVGAPELYTNNTGGSIIYSKYAANDILGFGMSRAFAAKAGTRSVVITPGTDTTKTFYSQSVDFKAGVVNSLFLTGEMPNVEAVYVAAESFPKYKDNVIGVRLINLSPNSPAISINMSGTPLVKEVASLSYKQKSDFKTYDGNDVLKELTFEIRDAATQVLLASYTIPSIPDPAYPTVSMGSASFYNITLVVKGLIGGTDANAFGVFPVPHF